MSLMAIMCGHLCTHIRSINDRKYGVCGFEHAGSSTCRKGAGPSTDGHVRLAGEDLRSTDTNQVRACDHDSGDIL